MLGFLVRLDVSSPGPVKPGTCLPFVPVRCVRRASGNVGRDSVRDTSEKNDASGVASYFLNGQTVNTYQTGPGAPGEQTPSVRRDALDRQISPRCGCSMPHRREPAREAQTQVLSFSSFMLVLDGGTRTVLGAGGGFRLRARGRRPGRSAHAEAAGTRSRVTSSECPFEKGTR